MTREAKKALFLLHENAGRRLAEALLAALKQTEAIHGGMFLQTGTLGRFHELDLILPRNTREEMEAAVAEEPFGTFVYGELAATLFASYKFDSSRSPTPLGQLQEFPDLAEFSQDLVERFQTLPWQYEVIVPLPLHSDNPAINHRFESGVIKLSPTIDIVRPNDAFRSSHPVVETAADPYSTQDESYPRNWSNRLYLRILEEGYIPSLLRTSPLERTEFLLRSLAGVGLALGLFWRQDITEFTPRGQPMYIYRKTERGMVPQAGHTLPAAFAAEFRKLEWYDAKRADTFPAWIDNRLDHLVLALEATAHGDRVFRSGQWLFDSYCSGSELLSYVQLTVALEILLGDRAVSDLVGLGTLLGNRCAYLVGESHSEREKVLGDFQRIYDTRSAIVHRGQNRLSSGERELLGQLRWLTVRAIDKELKLAREDKKRGQSEQSGGAV